MIRLGIPPQTCQIDGQVMGTDEDFDLFESFLCIA